MQRFLSLLVAVCAALAVATPVAAVKPDRYPGEIEGFVIEDACTFDVQFDVLLDRSRITDFYDQDGNLVRTQYNGSIVIRLTNLTTNESIDANVGGPGSDRYNDDGTVTLTFLGRSIPLLTDSSLTRGNFAFVFNADFTEIVAVPKATGFTEDMCVLLS